MDNNNSNNNTPTPHQLQSSPHPRASHHPKYKADRMRNTANEFCNAFVHGQSPSHILDQYFSPHATILEHGPSWANERLPFLGTPFHGRRCHSAPVSENPTGGGGGRTCDDYYDLLTSTLAFHPTLDTLPGKDDFMVDPDKGTVTVKLHAKFSSVKTGKCWEEDFIYVLGVFDEEWKIGSQELWADPLSAWMAVGD